MASGPEKWFLLYMAEKKTPDDRPTAAWHALDPTAALQSVSAAADGLSTSEAAERLEKHGSNRLPAPKPQGPLRRFAAQFHNVLIYVLLGAGVVTAGLGHWIDSGVIFGVVVVNALIGFIQEGKAERALNAIRNMLSSSATVSRDGRKTILPAEEVVPGDIVHVQSGDKVPADLRLIRIKNLQIQEAALTGESVPAEKAIPPVAAGAPLGDRTSMAYSGTIVTYGQGTGVVVGTGTGTEIGRISMLLHRVEPLMTPLIRQMAEFARWLTLGILVLAAITFVFGVSLRGYASGDMFLAAVGLAVAAIPEGLPAIMTITLAIGVQAMARRNAIIRRLPAVETLGSVSVICSDKTGTLTKNEMTVSSIATTRHLFDVTGAGYAPVGDFFLDGREIAVDHRPLLSALTRGMCLCSDAEAREADGQWLVDGDPTEGALVVAAMKAGVNPDSARADWPRIDTIPFESEHRFMATLHHDHEGHAVVYVKGAPEQILHMCAHQRSYDGVEALDADYWHGRMIEIAGRGQRLLALAVLEMTDGHRELRFDQVQSGLTMIGLVGLLDPPRPEAIEAVARCRAAGIDVKMITGDHVETAKAIAGQLGLVHPGEVLSGAAIDKLSDDELAERVRPVNVFARTSPEHKLRLVQALQANGVVLAMTGDGVNDAPALKRADVGIAMGLNGTEAAKEAAEMVLADDNFATIASAVEEGRTVYDNLKKAITFILPTNGGEALTIVAAIALGRVLPITAVQILWVNMITAVTLALALAFEPSERNVMARAPRRSDTPILSRYLVWRIVFVSLVLVAGTFGLFIWYREQGADVATARTVAVNTLVMFEVFYLFNTRFVERSVLNREGFLGSRAVMIAVVLVILAQIAYTYAPPMQFLFDSRPLSAGAWVRITLVASSVLFLVEIEKCLVRARPGRRSNGST
jgi:magnesium-transporting ATPase (P-type)